MILGLELIMEEQHATGMIPMEVNNTAAIIATHSIRPGPGHYLWDLFHQWLQMVANKHQDMDLLVRWTPGHIDIEGNEEVDKKAKAAAKHGSSPNQQLPSQLCKTLPHRKSAIHQGYHTKLKQMAVKVWKKSPQYEHMKRIDMLLPSDKFAKQTSKLPCKHASLLFQLWSGHILLNKHLHWILEIESPICPCCHQHDKTVMHSVMHCPAHQDAW
jgi:hypothetical protein